MSSPHLRELAAESFLVVRAGLSQLEHFPFQLFSTTVHNYRIPIGLKRLFEYFVHVAYDNDDDGCLRKSFVRRIAARKTLHLYRLRICQRFDRTARPLESNASVTRIVMRHNTLQSIRRGQQCIKTFHGRIVFHVLFELQRSSVAVPLPCHYCTPAGVDRNLKSYIDGND